mmetsp:Transcript_8390/g.20412  ORF Transcript_8390/g.20412 Transcript_8390/m.20412 type:complete len:209 (+) Transcript_8390:4590-5216(+)
MGALFVSRTMASRVMVCTRQDVQIHNAWQRFWILVTPTFLWRTRKGHTVMVEYARNLLRLKDAFRTSMLPFPMSRISAIQTSTLSTVILKACTYKCRTMESWETPLLRPCHIRYAFRSQYFLSMTRRWWGGSTRRCARTSLTMARTIWRVPRKPSGSSRSTLQSISLMSTRTRSSHSCLIACGLLTWTLRRQRSGLQMSQSAQMRVVL